MNGSYFKALYPVLLLFILVFTSPTHPQIYDHTVLPESQEYFTTARFRLYVPDSISIIRGVFFEVDLAFHDSRNVVHDPSYRQLCEDIGFALMGAFLDENFMYSGIGNAVLRSLETFAEISEHPELKSSSLFLNGWSWAGGFAYNFAKWNPQRTIGFITQKDLFKI